MNQWALAAITRRARSATKNTLLAQVYKFTLGVKLVCLGKQNNTKIFPQVKKQ
jgi:hypothetical protein